MGKTSDATLLRLYADFKAASDQEERSADRIEKIDRKVDRLKSRLRKRLEKAEAKVERRTEEASRLFHRIMKARAKSLDGMLVKVRTRKRWSSDDEETEILILKSLIADVKAIAGGMS